MWVPRGHPTALHVRMQTQSLRFHIRIQTQSLKLCMHLQTPRLKLHIRVASRDVRFECNEREEGLVEEIGESGAVVAW